MEWRVIYFFIVNVQIAVCMRIWERSLSRAYQLISFSWDKTKYLFSRYGLVKFENERWKILEIEKKNENKKRNEIGKNKTNERSATIGKKQS